MYTYICIYITSTKLLKKKKNENQIPHRRYQVAHNVYMHSRYVGPRNREPRHHETVVETRRGEGVEVLSGGDLILSRSYDRQTWFPKHRSIITRISSDLIHYTYVYVYPPPRAFLHSSFLHASCITCITRKVQFLYYFFYIFFYQTILRNARK